MAWRDWHAGLGTVAGTLAVAWQGDVVRNLGDGAAPDAQVPIASNSKAITAACIASFVDEGALAYDTPLGAVAGLTVPDGAARDITIGQLITHTAGLDGDGTQLRMNLWLNEEAPRHADASQRALERGPDADLIGSYAYSNDNYAVLGAVVEALAGDYTDACAERVLAPVGASGAPDQAFGAFAAWGGWAIAMPDYLAFIHATYGPDSPIGADPAAFPSAPLGGGARYGMGMLYRDTGAGPVFWHTGMLCFLLRDKTFSYAVNYENGWSVALWADTCPDDDVRAALDTALWQAVHE
jgi:CubicO group peptidase (beta-lactamase class C family)